MRVELLLGDMGGVVVGVANCRWGEVSCEEGEGGGECWGGGEGEGVRMWGVV